MFNRPAQSRTKVIGIRNRSFAVDSQTAGHRRVIDVRILDSRSDVRRRDPALPPIGHALEMHHFLMIGPVVVHHEQNWDAMMRSCPEWPRGIHEIAVILDADAQSAVLLVRKRCPDCGWQGRTYRRRTTAADRSIELVDVPKRRRRAADKRPIFVFDYGPQFGSHPRRAYGTGIPSVRSFCLRPLHSLGVRGCEFFAAFFRYALTIRSHEPFAGFDQCGKRGLGIGRNGEIHFGVALKVLIVAFRVKVLRRNADQLGPGFRNRACRPCLLIKYIVGGSPEVVDFQSEDDVRIGDRTSAQRMLVGDAASGDVLYRRLNRFCEFHHPLHTLFSARGIRARHNQWILRINQHLRDFVDGTRVGRRRRCQRQFRNP